MSQETSDCKRVSGTSDVIDKENKVEGEFGTSELLLRAFTEDGTADVEFLNHHLVNFKKSIEENIYEYLSLYLNGGIETITFG